MINTTAKLLILSILWYSKFLIGKAQIAQTLKKMDKVQSAN